MTMRFGRWLIGLSLLASVAAVAVGTPASAACGDVAYSDTYEYGDFLTTARIRSGPSTSCVSRGTGQPGHSAIYYCWKYGDADGYTWTYLYNLHTGVVGWTRDDLLDNYGAPNKC